MVMLAVMSDDAPQNMTRTTDFATSAAWLRDAGVTLRRWPISDVSIASATEKQVLDAYANQIAEICRREQFTVVDCVTMAPCDDPEWAERAAIARARFRAEHRHSEKEVRFFASGRGCFYLHIDTLVFAVICEAGDLLSVPAGTRHWFDMGPTPDMCAVRFFERADGWVGDFTGDELAARFPSLPELLSSFEVASCN